MSRICANYDLSSLQQIHIGGAAASPELIARMEQAFHCEVMAGYGLTETCPVASSARRKGTVHYADEAGPAAPSGDGRLAAAGHDIRVVDAEMTRRAARHDERRRSRDRAATT